MKNIGKFNFYLLSFTWGLPLTLTGLMVALVLICTGHKPQKWGYCYYFEVGENWGGLEIGIIFLKGKRQGEHTKNHEHGHAIQNCYWGPLTPFVICMPSAIRYWYRRIRTKLGLENKTAYDDFWVEGQASRWGTSLITKLNNTK